MNNLFQDALNKAGVKATDFEDREVNEKEIKCQEQLDFWETWMKMLERNASEKEQHNFLVKHGFLSITQFKLWCGVSDDLINLENKLEFDDEIMSDKEKKSVEEEIQQKKSMAEAIKRPSYYRMVMRTLKQKDISPYGEDILKSIGSPLDRERVWSEKDFQNCQGFRFF